MGPETGLRSGDAGASASNADVLAGEAAADDVHGNSICSQSVGGEGSNIIVAYHVGPVPLQNFPAEHIDFAECDRGHPGPLKAETETTDAAEKVEDVHTAS